MQFKININARYIKNNNNQTKGKQTAGHKNLKRNKNVLYNQGLLNETCQL